MDIVTARWNIPAGTPAPPPSGSNFFILPVTGRVLLALSVLCPLSTYDPAKSGFRILDSGGRQVYPAQGQADDTTVIKGRGAYAPLMPLGSAEWIYHLDDELSGPPYNLKFDFYNEDASAFIAMVRVGVGEDLRPMAVNISNFAEIIQPIGGMLTSFINRLFPPKG